MMSGDKHDVFSAMSEFERILHGFGKVRQVANKDG